ncbi:hypothetical protein [Natronorubrum sp. DTA7]|uniref:hypothetical protein n=1 Tax=Natronorubrum sp. DTA7 TaxID=3447016 RepID=UPI003F82CCF8
MTDTTDDETAADGDSIETIDKRETHHDQGVSFEVTMQHGSSSDRTRVKAKLKSETLEDFADEKGEFLDEVRDGAAQALDDHEDVFHDDA